MKAASTLAGSPTSTRTAYASISSASGSISERFRAITVTRYPRLLNRRAVAAPILRPPPVTTTCLAFGMFPPGAQRSRRCSPRRSLVLSCVFKVPRPLEARVGRIGIRFRTKIQAFGVSTRYWPAK